MSLSKVFVKWKQFYLLMFNLYFYRVNSLLFGTTFFRREILSLNWNLNSGLRNFWKYVNPFLTFRSTKIFNHGWVLFSTLKLRGYTTAFIFDALYHNKTLYYLRTNNYYTIGLVPTNLSCSSLDFALPSSSDNIFTQLFFIRFILKVRKTVEFTRLADSSSSWSCFLKKIV